MKALSVILVLLSFAAIGQSTEIATVDFESIEPVLKELVLSKSRNADLKQSVEASPDFAMPPDTETDEQGNIVFKMDFKRVRAQREAFEKRRELRDQMRRELLVVISDLELGFDLIIDSSDPSAIIFSAVDPRDITQRVYQEIVFRLSNSRQTATAVAQE